MAKGPYVFVSTRWSLVARAAAPESPDAREALEELFRSYWWPLYAYSRRLGLDGDDAADVVQGLFADLLAKKRLAHVDPSRGRFRCWLLQALKYHLSHERGRKRAAKRGGAARIVSIDAVTADRRWAEIADPRLDPDRLYDRAWALTVLGRALDALERAYVASGKGELFAALKPKLIGDLDARDLDTLAARLGLSTAALKSASHRLRRALGAAIRTELAETLDEGCDLEEELGALFSALAHHDQENP